MIIKILMQEQSNEVKTQHEEVVGLDQVIDELVKENKDLRQQVQQLTMTVENYKGE
jgi:hypothetical protein